MTQGELAPADGTAKKMPKIIGISGPTRAGKTTLFLGDPVAESLFQTGVSGVLDSNDLTTTDENESEC